MDELTTNLCGEADRARVRVLVLDADLSSAEATATALARQGMLARFALPLSSEHLRDLLSWQPDLALLEVDQVAGDRCTETISLLQDKGVAVIALTTNSRRHREVSLADIVFDRGSADHDLRALLALLRPEYKPLPTLRPLTEIDDGSRPTNPLAPAADGASR